MRPQMSPKIKTCALVGRFSETRIADSGQLLAAHLVRAGVQAIALDADLAGAQLEHVQGVSEKELVRRADLVLTLGGDGTLLYAAGLVAEHGTPLLGINRGRLGFLTDVLPEDMLAGLDAALRGDCEVDRRPLLRAEVQSGGTPRSAGLALNDVVMQKTDSGRILDFETHIDDRYVNSHGGDGLVISTATGSTAYALSCGGPIVEPGLDILVLAPICPHTLSDRPIVISGRSTIQVTLVERPDACAQVTCDGRVLGDMAPGDSLLVRPSRHNINLLHPAGYDYYRLLRSKLHWGHRSFDALR